MNDKTKMNRNGAIFITSSFKKSIVPNFLFSVAALQRPLHGEHQIRRACFLSQFSARMYPLFSEIP
jgi:hypothetical protein